MDRTEFEALIPHRGTMCLLDRVVAWSADALHAQSDAHRRADCPLRDGAILRALHLAEFGAQAMAVHGALLGRAAGAAVRPGLLVALRDVRLSVARIDDLPGPLDVHADKLLDAGGSWHYEFRVDHAGVRLASGRATVVMEGPA